MNASGRNRLDLLVCAALAMTALATSLAQIEAAWLRTALGVPLALFLPGYALMSALFPRNTGSTLRDSTRIMFAIGTSIVIGILTGFLLNFTALGINTFPLTVSLSGLTLLLCALGFRALGVEQRFAAVPLREQLERRGFSFSQLSLLGIALVIAIGAVAYSIQEANRIQTPDVLEMWLLPAQPDNGTLRFGVRNVNATQTDFRIEVQRNGFMLYEWRQISVAPGQTWEVTTTLGANLQGNGPIEASLYAADERDVPLRRTQYWPR